MQVSFHTLGDEAILVRFEQRIDPDINERAVRLGEFIEQELREAIRYVVPAYCSLTIVYDKSKISTDSLEREVERGLALVEEETIPERMLYVPVCYDKSFAIDMEEVCEQTQLSSSEVVRYHSAQAYRVYMIGFLPGFPYLGQLPDQLKCERKSNPSLKVPAGSVAIAGSQTGIYPLESPGGWQIIGKTPLPLINVSNTTPFLFKQGDRVTFYSISLSKFREIRNTIQKGKFDWESIYG